MNRMKYGYLTNIQATNTYTNTNTNITYFMRKNF